MEPDWFPELDEQGNPTERLPRCPECGKRRLGLAHEDKLVCHYCGWSRERINTVYTVCPVCKLQTEVEQDMDIPNRYLLNCACGYVTWLTREKE